MSETLPIERRREVFLALVTAQDTGLSVLASREKVANEQGVSARELLKIEKEGLQHQWPPLEE
ncbi:MAG TPA: hypothetical protein VG097_15485 [Gemmata sp.]|jgi:hypothetical protein|nr:hypothetical protein [Gemmata sp.]